MLYLDMWGICLFITDTEKYNIEKVCRKYGSKMNTDRRNPLKIQLILLDAFGRY